MNRKSIILVVNTLTHGGAEIQVSRLANGLYRRGWRVDVVSMLPPDALEGQLREAGIRVHCLDMKRGVPNPLAIIRLARIIRAYRPQIVHSHIVHANLLTRVTRLLVKFPVLVCTAHSYKEGGRFHDLGYRITDPLSDLTTTVSQAADERYVRLGLARPNAIRFIPNGIDVRLYHRDPALRTQIREQLKLAGRFVWLVVARLEPDKNHVNLFRAFASAAVDHPANPILLVVGAGRLEPELRGLVEMMRLGERVRFLGLRDDIPALMNAADAQVLASLMEGMPLVLQEASAVGIPLLATNVGGNAEVVLDGKSGLIVPSEDSPALAQAMRTIMSMTPAQRGEMGRAGRLHVETNYDIDRVLDRWEAIYEELSATRRVGALATVNISQKEPNDDATVDALP